MNVWIVVPTLERPALLADCIDSIAKLEVSAQTALSLVVVDNDAAQSAKAVCEARRGKFPFYFYYAHQRRKMENAAYRLAGLVDGLRFFSIPLESKNKEILR